MKNIIIVIGITIILNLIINIILKNKGKKSSFMLQYLIYKIKTIFKR